MVLYCKQEYSARGVGLVRCWKSRAADQLEAAGLRRLQFDRSTHHKTGTRERVPQRHRCRHVDLRFRSGCSIQDAVRLELGRQGRIGACSAGRSALPALFIPHNKPSDLPVGFHHSLIDGPYSPTTSLLDAEVTSSLPS